MTVRTPWMVSTVERRRPRPRPSVLTFDTGGLVGLEPGSLRVRALLDRLAGSGQRIAVPPASWPAPGAARPARDASAG